MSTHLQTIAAPEISVVIPLKNEQASLQVLLKRVIQTLDGLHQTYEMIFVNDGSDDETLDLLLAKQKICPALRVLDLSRNFGKEAALTAGLDHARGKAVVVMDADLQDPPELIAEMVAKWKEGFEVVYGVRRSRRQDVFLKKVTAGTFYALFNWLSEVKLPSKAGDFRLMDRGVVEALKRLPEHTRFMKGLFAWVGFRQTGIAFDRPARQAGSSQWPFAKLFKFAFDGIFSFSTVPLKLWTWTGVLMSCFALTYAIYLTLKTLTQGIDVPGYASLMVAVMFFGGIQLISIGIVGEYLGRIFTEAKARPIYVIRKAYEPPGPPGSRNAQPASPNAAYPYDMPGTSALLSQP